MKIIKGKRAKMEADIIVYEKDDHEKMVNHIFTEFHYSRPKGSPNDLRLFLLSSFGNTVNAFKMITKGKTAKEISKILQ